MSSESDGDFFHICQRYVFPGRKIELEICSIGSSPSQRSLVTSRRSLSELYLVVQLPHGKRLVQACELQYLADTNHFTKQPQSVVGASMLFGPRFILRQYQIFLQTLYLPIVAKLSASVEVSS